MLLSYMYLMHVVVHVHDIMHDIIHVHVHCNYSTLLLHVLYVVVCSIIDSVLVG